MNTRTAPKGSRPASINFYVQQVREAQKEATDAQYKLNNAIDRLAARLIDSELPKPYDPDPLGPTHSTM